MKSLDSSFSFVFESNAWIWCTTS